jgi:hypothetical protein
MKAISKFIATLVLVSAGSNIALAAEADVQPQPIMINNNGIAFSRMEEGQVLAYDPVAAFDSHTVMLADCGAHKAELQGVSWCFASAENAQTFIAATTESGQNKYIPFGGGHCSLGLAFNNLVARGDPRTAVRVGDSLVLNGNFDHLHPRYNMMPYHLMTKLRTVDLIEDPNEIEDVVVMNPKVLEVANEVFANHPRVRLIEPMDVLDFHNFIHKSYLILSI